MEKLPNLTENRPAGAPPEGARSVSLPPADLRGRLRDLGALKRELEAELARVRAEAAVLVVEARARGISFRCLAVLMVPLAGEPSSTERQRRLVEVNLRKLTWRSRSGRNVEVAPDRGARPGPASPSTAGGSTMSEINRTPNLYRRTVTVEEFLPEEGDLEAVPTPGCPRPLTATDTAVDPDDAGDSDDDDADEEVGQ